MGSAAEGFALLGSTVATPIAHLNPDLSDQEKRVVVGEVTIVWPYNSVTQTLAFLLAEPDVLLRRTKGLVRVQIRGPGATRVAECKLGGGDTVALCLDGVNWGKDNSAVRVPATRLDWQLEFAGKLKLEARVGHTQEIQNIDIDLPFPDTPLDTVTEPQSAAPGPRSESPVLRPQDRQTIDIETSEFKSPAFLKRARSSYGLLFEGALDIFEDDGGVKGQGRKRSRFGRDSSMWKYASRSPSPEAESPSPQQQEEPALIDVAMQSSPAQKPQMTDGGCQTIEFDMTPIHAGSLAAEPLNAGLEEQQSLPAASPSVPQPASSPTREADKEVAELTHAPTTSLAPSHTLFGSLAQGHDAYSVPRFGAATLPQTDDGSSVADRVRFGFSHQPQAILPPDMEMQSTIAGPQVSTSEEQYPGSYLNEPATTKYPDMDSYIDAAEQEHETEPTFSYGMPQEPPVVETFGHGQWDMSTQSQAYNPVEGGHFGTDALDEGYRINTGEEALRSDDIHPEQVPVGFDSYGAPNPEASEVNEAEEEPDRREIPGESLVENEENESALDDEVGIEEEDDAEYDEDGGVIEQGDYDQRQYDAPADDDEGISEEDEVEEEVAERYGEQDVTDYEEEYSDDDEDENGPEMAHNGELGDDYGDESEEYESEEDDSAYQPWVPPTPRAAPSKQPVVISLLSDSEDEDDEPEPPKQPEQRASVEQRAPSREATQARPLSGQPVPELLDANAGANQHPGQLSESNKIQTGDQQDAGIWNDAYPSHLLFDEARADVAASDEAKLRSGELPAHIEAMMRQGSSDHPEAILRQEEYIEKDMAGTAEDGGNNHVDMEMVDASDRHASQEPGVTGAQERRTRESELGGTSQPAGLGAVEGSKVSPAHSPQDINPEDEDRGAEPGTPDEQQPQGGYNESAVDVDMAPAEDDLFGEDPSTIQQSNSQYKDPAADAGDQHTGADHEMPSSPPLTQQVEPRDLEKEAIATLSSLGGQPNSSNEPMEEFPPTPIETQPSDLFLSQQFGSEWDSAQTGLGMAEQTELAAESEIQLVGVPRRFIQEEVVQEEIMQEEFVQEDIVHEEHVQMQLVQEEQEFLRAEVGESNQEQEETLIHEQVEETMQEQEEEPAQEQDEPIQEEEQEPVEELEPEPEPETMENVQAATQELEQEAVREPEVEPMQPVPEEATEPLGNGVEATAPDTTTRGDNDHDSSQEAEETQKSPSPIPVAQVADDEVEPLATGDDMEVSNAPMELVFDDEATPLASQEIEPAEPESTPPKQLFGSSPPSLPPGPTRTPHQAKVKPTKKGKAKKAAQQQSSPPKEEEHRAKEATPDSSIQLARAALASKKGSAKKVLEPLASPRKTRAQSGSFKMSATPEFEDSSIRLAKAALTSPSKLSVEGEVASPGAVKSGLSKRLRTELPGYTALKNIRNHLNKSVDVVAVVTTQPPEPQRAKRQYMMSFNITDPSLAPNHVIEVQFFRAHKEFLPAVKPGDSIILKHFQVVSLTKRGFGLRTSDESCWAVFDNEHGRPETKGQAIDLGGIEPGYASSLKSWYGALDGAALAKVEKANQKMVDENRAK